MESKYADADEDNTFQVCDLDSKTAHLASPPPRRGLGLDLSRARPSTPEEMLERDGNMQESEVLVSISPLL